MEHLTVLSPEAVAFHIEGIAECLGPSTVEHTLPLNAAKCPQLPFAIVAGNQVVLQDGIQLPCSPLQVVLGGYLKLLPIVLADPRCQFFFLKVASGQSDGICYTDTQATLALLAAQLVQ